MRAVKPYYVSGYKNRLFDGITRPIKRLRINYLIWNKLKNRLKKAENSIIVVITLLFLLILLVLMLFGIDIAVEILNTYLEGKP